jgi:NifU-like protein
MKPEILEADLSSTVLSAALWGTVRIDGLPWLTPPPESAWGNAVALLQLLGALDADGRIADVKFQTFGCASAIASSSALTELIKGKTLEEAEKITNKEIAEYLGGLPDQKMHCSVMGREALEAAVENYRTGKNTDRNLEESTLCTCFNVSENEIRRVITENQLTSVEEVTNFTKAGGGCGMCREKIEAILKEMGV